MKTQIKRIAILTLIILITCLTHIKAEGVSSKNTIILNPLLSITDINPAIEEIMRIKTRMMNDNNWVNENTNPLFDIEQEIEQELFIEPWMVNDSLFQLNINLKTPPLTIENWMMNDDLWTKKYKTI